MFVQEPRATLRVPGPLNLVPRVFSSMIFKMATRREIFSSFAFSRKSHIAINRPSNHREQRGKQLKQGKLFFMQILMFQLLRSGSFGLRGKGYVTIPGYY